MRYLPIQSNPEWRAELERFAKMGDVNQIQRTKEKIYDLAKTLLDDAHYSKRELTSAENNIYNEMTCDLEYVGSLLEKARFGEARKISAFSSTYSKSSSSESRSYDWQRLLNRESGSYEMPLGEVMQKVQGKNAIERRDILTTTATLIPTQVLEELTTRLQQSSGVLSANPRIINTESLGGYTLKANQISTLGTATAVGEGSAIPENDPTITTVSFGAYKYGRLLEVSNEMLSDAFFDLERYLGEEMQLALSNTLATDLISGSGTATIQGVLQNVTTGVTSGTAVSGTVTYANLIGLYGSLPSQYRANSSFIMASSTLTTIAQLLDGQNRSLLLPSLSTDSPTTLFGRPVYLDDNMPTLGLSKKAIWFGDMSRFYAVRFAQRLAIDVSRDYAFNRDVTTYRVLQRLDGRIVDTNAARAFIGAAS